MNERNSHQRVYRGPAKGIPTRTWRSKLTDIVSVTYEPAVYVIGVLVVLLDIFLWRP